MAINLCLFFIFSSRWIQETSDRIEELKEAERKMPVDELLPSEVEQMAANIAEGKQMEKSLGQM